MIETAHMTQRQSQRSIPGDVVEVIFLFGKCIGDDKVYFSRKSAEKAKSELSVFEYPPSNKQLSSGTQSDTALFFGHKNTKRSKITNKKETNKQWIHLLDNYVGVSLIIDGDVAITCYRCRKNQKKKMSWLCKEKFVH